MDTAELIAATQDLRAMVGLKEDPIAFFYSDRQPDGYRPTEGKWSCLVAHLARARRGETVFFDVEHYGCGGSGYYLGYTPPLPHIDAFVSTGIPGEMEGERYKKSPALMREYRETHPPRQNPPAYAVFKPVPALALDERPEVILYFATADELSGLVFLANYPRADEAVVCAFASGCGGLVTRPLNEAQHQPPRAVLSLFDPSARPFVPATELSFSAPVAMWEEMLENRVESFLGTPTWAKVRQRLTKLRGE